MQPVGSHQNNTITGGCVRIKKEKEHLDYSSSAVQKPQKAKGGWVGGGEWVRKWKYKGGGGGCSSELWLSVLCDFNIYIYILKKM